MKCHSSIVVSRCLLFRVAIVALVVAMLFNWHVSAVFSQEVVRYRANVGFLQGDAFFHAWLREDLCNDIEAGEGDLELKYAGPALSGTMGYFAGYSNIRISGIDRETRRGIAISYRKFRENNLRNLLEIIDRDGNVDLKEINPLNLFVYPADSDFSKQRIGVKYNDSWRDLKLPVKGSGEVDLPPRRAPAYVSFVQSESAILEDWGNAGVYPTLAVVPQTASFDSLLFGPEALEAVHVPMCKVKFVILFHSEIDEFFERSSRCRWIEILNSAEIAVKYFSESRVAVTDAEASSELNMKLSGLK